MGVLMNLEDSKLKYNNGVFSHSNFSFSFPENFYFKLYDCLLYTSDAADDRR